MDRVRRAGTDLSRLYGKAGDIGVSGTRGYLSLGFSGSSAFLGSGFFAAAATVFAGGLRFERERDDLDFVRVGRRRERE